MSVMIREIESIIGGKSLSLFLTRYSGQRVYVPLPESLHNDHHLVTLMGKDTAKKFCAHFGGVALYVPMNNAAKIATRNHAIIKDYSTGMKVSDLARRHGISERTVERALNGK